MAMRVFVSHIIVALEISDAICESRDSCLRDEENNKIAPSVKQEIDALCESGGKDS